MAEEPAKDKDDGRPSPNQVAANLLHSARFYAGEVTNANNLTHWNKDLLVPGMTSGVQSPKVWKILMKTLLTERTPPDRTAMELIKALIIAQPLQAGQPEPVAVGEIIGLKSSKEKIKEEEEVVSSPAARLSSGQAAQPTKIVKCVAMMLDTCMNGDQDKKQEGGEKEGEAPVRRGKRTAVVTVRELNSDVKMFTPHPPSASPSKTDSPRGQKTGKLGRNGVDPRRGSVKVPQAKLETDSRIDSGAGGLASLKTVPKLLLHFILEHLIEYMSLPKVTKKKQEMVPHHVVTNMMSVLMELWRRLTPEVLPTDLDAEMVLIKIRDLVRSLYYQQKLLDKSHVDHNPNEPLTLILDGEHKIQQTWESLLYISRMMTVRLLQLSPPLVASAVYSDTRKNIQSQRTNLESRNCHWGKLASSKSWNLPQFMGSLQSTTTRLYMDLSPRCTISNRDYLINNFPHTPIVQRFKLIQRFSKPDHSTIPTHFSPATKLPALSNGPQHQHMTYGSPREHNHGFDNGAE
mmetsp:Transcript_35667/g.42993  ORF Transcript_35667/g.42993 Transcript_35667/m.42993 type:complete len:517 (+) Transcript_35667:291-1841(+)|eukprot:CAMPEP_0197852728 /NCGR_PEP_ID=MMETSP1438-20131217/21273_1 /TAXON_ID=1461541 /ORGANISM="Pterosperma sp., Strain CCMP1384" /LENGTH=516 /DNA_ID=CAMNT_0043466889 /DNA_START=148 /DNA_END=1698 /DNA_ORIENTATION=-